jgi:predicted ferric reductase/Ca2+-binding EF-hand superfamily protein
MVPIAGAVQLAPTEPAAAGEAAGECATGSDPQRVVIDGRDDLAQLAQRLIYIADVDQNGAVDLDEFIAGTSLKQKIAAAVFRSAGIRDDELTEAVLIKFLRVLTVGSLTEKVKVFFDFMDEDGSGHLSVDEVESFLDADVLRATSILNRLGFEDGAVDRTQVADLTFEKLLSVFVEAPKGAVAIDIFCGSLLAIMDKAAHPRISHRPQKVTRQPATEGGPSKSYFTRPGWLPALHNTLQTKFKVGLVFMQLFCFLLYFVSNWWAGKSIPICFAKGFGLNVRILSVFLFYSMCRTTLGQLYLTSLARRFVPLGVNLQVHAFAGTSLLFHSLGHVAAHLVNAEVYLHIGIRGQAELKSLENGGWRYHGSGSGGAISGYALIALIVCISSTAALRSFSGNSYYFFVHVHSVGYAAWLIFLFVHVANLWRWWLAIIVLFVCDRGYAWLFMTTITTLSLSRPAPDGITFLCIDGVGAPPPEAGSFYRIIIPDIAPFEWHSFSFAGNVQSPQLNFFVQAAGDWTHALYDIVQDPALREQTTVIVQGPFRTPACDVFTSGHQRVLLVATGIGVTPWLGCIATKITNMANDEANQTMLQQMSVAAAAADDDDFSTLQLQRMLHRPTRNVFGQMPIRSISRLFSKRLQPGLAQGASTSLHVIWSVRDAAGLIFFMEYRSVLTRMQETLQHKDDVHVDVHFTGVGSSSDPAFMVTQTLFLLVQPTTNAHISILYARPDIATALAVFRPDAVYYCGGEVLRDVVAKQCEKRKIVFRPESFDGGTNRIVALLGKMMRHFKRVSS